MPAYDQTNPNFAAYLSPSTFVTETNPVPNFGSNALFSSCKPVNNPFDQSWLPWGPFSGDANSLGNSCAKPASSYLCCPTAEAMALMAAIASKTYSGWTSMFDAGQTPAPASGLTNQAGPIFPFVPDTRTNMQVIDVQRVIDMALAQGTKPNAGGREDYISSPSVTGTFTPAAVGTDNDGNTVSNATFIDDIQAGTIIVIAKHTYTAHINNSNVTFTFNGGGHCLAVKGFTVLTTRPIGGPQQVTQALQIINPWFGVQDSISIVQLPSGPVTSGGNTRTVTLPNSYLTGLPLTSVGIWPDPANPVNSAFDILPEQPITFIDEFHTLNVP